MWGDLAAVVEANGGVRMGGSRAGRDVDAEGDVKDLTEIQEIGGIYSCGSRDS